MSVRVKIGVFILVSMLSAIFIAFFGVKPFYVKREEDKLYHEIEAQFVVFEEDTLSFLNQVEHGLDLLLENDNLYIDHSGYTNYLSIVEDGFVFSPGTNEQDIMDDFLFYKESSPISEYVYIGFETGEFVIDSRVFDDAAPGFYSENYDPRNSNWYEAAIENPDNLVFTDIYRARTDTVAVGDFPYFSTVAKTFTNDNNEFVGVIGMDIVLTDFLPRFELPSYLSYGEHGIVQGSGLMMFETDEAFLNDDDLLNDYTITNLANKYPEINMDQYDEGGFYHFEQEINGVKSAVIIYNVEDLNMTYIQVIPLSEIKVIVGAIVDPVINIFTGLFVVIMLGLYFVLNFFVLSPLNRIKLKTDKLSDLNNLSIQFDSNTNDEFGAIARSFNNMLHQIHDSTHNMNLRMKELNCLYLVANSARRKDTLEEIFIDTLQAIEESMQFPELTRARILYHGKEFNVRLFDQTEYKLSMNIVEDGNVVGAIEVYYTEKTPDEYDGPFLKEEVDLLISITQTINISIESQVTRNNLKKRNTEFELELKERTKELKDMMIYSDYALELSNSAYWSVDFKEPDILIASERAIKLYGLPYKEGYRYQASENWELVLAADPTFFDREVQIQADAIANGDTYFEDLTPIRRKDDNEFRWINLAGRIEYDENMNPKFIYGVVQDVTEKVKAEEEIKEAREIAEAATKAKSDFLANMSHEIRTPMNAIIGLSNLLSKTELNTKQQDYVIKTTRAANNLLGIINDILDFSKIEAGKLDIEKIEFDLDEVLDNISSIVGIKAFNQGIEFVISKKFSLHNKLVGDPLRLGQVILNLANNAIKFTSEGQVLLQVDETEIIGNQINLKFQVMDTGIGMTPEQVSKLFQAFNQADTSTTRKYGGTGLGLSISKTLVELMGGTIGVESVHQEGSTFFFDLMFDLGETIETKNYIMPEDIGNINVLIVDDNETSRIVVEDYLNEFKIKSIQAKDGYDALKKVNGDIDLVFLDWKMPGMNGVETWTKIKEHFEKEQMKLPEVIMLTAYGREEVLDSANTAGIDIVLMKPISQPHMYNSILQIFGKEVDSNITGSNDNNPDVSSIAGAKILLVEDNEINQQVAKETLEYEGFYVDIAENGKIAVDLNEKNQYDIILMDLQMPVMSGYEATEEIRKSGYKDIPIIALSADAMSGVLEKIEQIGMNGFVAKPIIVKDLFEALLKWIDVDESRVINKVANTGVENSNDLSILKRIEYTNGLNRVANNEKVYIDILRKYVKNYSNFIEDLEHAIQSEEDDIARRLHSLKGVAGNIGAIKTQELAKRVESAYKNDINILEQLEYSQLSESLNLDVLDITSFLNTIVNQKDQGEILSDDDLLKSLHELVDKLDEYSAESINVLDHISSTLSARKVSFSEIKDDIDSYEFEDALDKVNKIITNVKGEM